MSGDKAQSIPIANGISLGAPEETVSKRLSGFGGVSHRKSREWSLLTTGLLSEWVLYVHYTEGIVDFVGIADSDRIRWPTSAPPWRAAGSFRFEETIQKGISFNDAVMQP